MFSSSKNESKGIEDINRHRLNHKPWRLEKREREKEREREREREKERERERKRRKKREEKRDEEEQGKKEKREREDRKREKEKIIERKKRKKEKRHTYSIGIVTKPRVTTKEKLNSGMMVVTRWTKCHWNDETTRVRQLRCSVICSVAFEASSGLVRDRATESR